MARGKAHSDETRAAVIAELLTGQSVHAVATQYKVSRSTVRAWRALARAFFRGELGVNHPFIDRIGDLVTAYLVETLTTLRLQQVLFRDKEWLRKQSAADLAVLIGVCCDKVFRILEALQATETLADDHSEMQRALSASKSDQSAAVGGTR